MAATTVKTIYGTLTRDDLKRLTWPVAWSGVVPESERIEEEAARCKLAQEGIQAIDEAEQYNGGEWAARIESGEIVEVVMVEKAE